MQAASDIAATPLVSIIVPVFNAERVLARAVSSVLAQSLDDWELVLIDDGSRDASRAVIATQAARDPRIKTLFQPHNTGAAAARNQGIAHARGRYIAFLDADDEWMPDKLRRQIAHMSSMGAPLGYTGFWRAKKDGRRHRMRVPPSVTREVLLRGNVIGCLTAIYDRSRFGTVFMPDVPLSHDYALWLDLLGRIDHGVGLDEPLAVYHRSPGSLTKNRFCSLHGTWRVYRDLAGQSRRAACANLWHHVTQRIGSDR